MRLGITFAPYRTEGGAARSATPRSRPRRSALPMSGSASTSSCRKTGPTRLGGLLGPVLTLTLAPRTPAGSGSAPASSSCRAPPAAIGQRVGDLQTCRAGGSFSPGRRLARSRVRRIGRAVPRARPAHGRGIAMSARGVERDPVSFPAPHSGGHRRHRSCPSRKSDPDLDRRHLGAGAGAGAEARRLARLARLARAGGADRRTAARGAPHPGFAVSLHHGLTAAIRRTASPARRLRRGSGAGMSLSNRPSASWPTARRCRTHRPRRRGDAGMKRPIRHPPTACRALAGEGRGGGGRLDAGTA